MQIQNRIKSRVVDHIRVCSGKAVVVIDEIQKISPGALDILMPGLSERGSFTVDQKPSANESYLDAFWRLTESSTPVQVKTENVVFIFISDIGAELMTKMLLTYGDRSLIPKTELRNEVRAALDQQWARLKFGKVISEVIPFLPLEPVHIREILRDKLERMSEHFKLVNWNHFHVDDDVIDYMIGPNFIKYTVHHPQKRSLKQTSDGLVLACSSDSVDGSCSVGEETAKSRIFATWGARSLDNAGLIQFT